MGLLSGEQSVGEAVPLFSRKSTALDLAEIVIFRFYEFQNIHSYSSRSNTKSQHLPSCIRVLVRVILILEFMPL